jgi:hypothetical protein
MGSNSNRNNSSSSSNTRRPGPPPLHLARKWRNTIPALRGAKARAAPRSLRSLSTTSRRRARTVDTRRAARPLRNRPSPHKALPAARSPVAGSKDFPRSSFGVRDPSSFRCGFSCLFFFFSFNHSIIHHSIHPCVRFLHFTSCLTRRISCNAVMISWDTLR